MRIQDIIPPEAVVDGLLAETKEGVLRELSEAVCRRLPALSPDRLTAILMDREGLGSTGIGEGVAIPHGKIPGIDRLVAVFGRSPAGVQFASLDGKPARLFFLILAPENSAGMGRRGRSPGGDEGGGPSRALGGDLPATPDPFPRPPHGDPDGP